MRRFVFMLAACVVMSSPSESQPSQRIRDNEVSLGAVRMADDRLQQNGFSRPEAWHATGVLIAWLHDAGTLNDAHMGEALTSMVTMLKSGAADPEEMKRLCAVAPKWIDYMARGAGLSRPQVLAHLKGRTFEARTALLNMIVSAGLDHTGKGEWRFVEKARALESRP